MDNKFKRTVIIFVVLVLLATGYIFSNSLKHSTESNGESHFIMNIIKPIIDPYNKIDNKTFHIFIRKTAHFVEFSLVGALITILSYFLQTVFKHRIISFPFLYCLSVAVTDEFIQKFTGRTSAVKDVIIDFGGAAFGIILTAIVIGLLIKKKKLK